MSYHIHVGCISTHAPAGGATFRLTDDQAKKLISTHAPAGGATGLDLAAEWAGFTFLLTPLREGRLRRKLLKKANVNFYSRPCGRGDFQHCRIS